jgi:hypothetical protein
MSKKPEGPITVQVSVGDDKQLTAKIGDEEAKKIQEFAAFMAGTPGAPAAIGDNNGATAINATGPGSGSGGSSKGGKSRRNRKSRGGKSRKGRKSLRRK